MNHLFADQGFFFIWLSSARRKGRWQTRRQRLMCVSPTYDGLLYKPLNPGATATPANQTDTPPTLNQKVSKSDLKLDLSNATAWAMSSLNQTLFPAACRVVGHNSFFKLSIVGSLHDREVACSASDLQGLNFESCVWRAVSLTHLTILRRFSWPNLACMCTKHWYNHHIHTSSICG